ncbi:MULTISPECIES: serine/threonine-protein kinase PknD [Mycobacterium]|uniref:non-specific serine/threonine protein kinase n=1 Tax=Mycobacterium gordonae TaxID=1778 RepID=A0A1A6B926_MYCGO|nr:MULTISPECIES: serine/threonine-protein kinase PknD [Mycobacterium]MBI2700135.1 protein kinase [Mycobacterium sp.]MBX9979193.1 protein kinase [Mycobacterium gordonae]MCQ4364827.1 serine/threonine-protein kinase PknD [Mycobacterium gordonae]MCV7008010.1 protein kinase [Mycobacterium gordonae]OBR98785.1 serine/threonine protein kinase [Mycobacterium gordonae]
MTNTGSESRVGSRFGPYQLVRLIGRGGMGEVYEAEDTRKHRVVALKLISTQFSNNPVFRSRMQREADIAGRLNEPHIVPIHDYGELDGHFFVEMRLIDGVSLRSMLTQFGPLTPARTVAIIRQVAAALDAAHASGITHRDVKPENILVAQNDFAYLVDFGIARAAHDPNLTQSGMAVGTYNYMAPERFTGDDVTYRADIYALACVLGECLTGAPPYRADSVERLIASHLMEPVPRPSVLRPGRVPAALDQVIAKGMAKNPSERYMTAGDLAMAAHEALSTPEQRQEATILRQGDNETLMLPAVDPGAGGWNSQGGSGSHPSSPATMRAPVPPFRTGDETMAQPLPSNTGGWRERPQNNSDQFTQAAPVAAAGWASHPGVAPSGPVPMRPPPYQQPSQPHAMTPPPPEAPKSRKSRKALIIGAAAAAVLLVVIAATAFFLTRPGGNGSSTQNATGQQTMPFNGLNFRFAPGGVAVDPSGTIYVTNQTMYGRVVALPDGSTSPTVKPFNGLYEPQGIAVDAAGKIYVSDFNNRVVALAGGSNNQVVLPFNGLNYPEGVAVDPQGSVYVADRGNNRVLKLAAGSNAQTELPFQGLKNPDGVALDSEGNIYVTDTDNNRVLMLDAGTSNQTVLPFTGMSAPWGITVDGAGNVYVTEHDNNVVAKLPAGATASVELPFNGLNTPLSVAVDKKGNVYVADRGNGRVLRLPPGS